MRRQQRTYEFTVTFAASAESVAARLPSLYGTPEPLDDGNCVLRGATGDAPEWLAFRLAGADCDFTVGGPPELVATVAEMGARFTRAASPVADPPDEGDEGARAAR